MLSNNGYGYFSYVLFMIAGIVLTLDRAILLRRHGHHHHLRHPRLVRRHRMPLTSFRISAAVVLGENIGTTVTAWLASLGANTEAKRAARAHFTFNVIGTVWMLAIFPLFAGMVWMIADQLPEGLKSAKDDFGASEVAFATAIFHTTFNLINVFALIWFVPQIASVVQKWVPKEEEDGSKTRLRYISQNLVDLGEMNLAEADSAIRKMSAHTNEMYQGFVKVFETPGADLSSEVSRLKKMEDEADLMMQDITEYLVKCSAHDIREEQAASIAQMIRIVSELEEITDTIYRLVKLVERKYNKDHQFSEHQTKRIGEMTSVVGQALSAVDNYILQPVPPEVITSVKSLEDQTDNMRKTFNKEAIKRMAEGDIKVEMIYTDINNQLEALANHTLNVMEASSQATPPTT